MTTKKEWKKHFLRMKQMADQNLGRAEKSEVLNEELVLLEKRVSKIKAACQSTIKRLSACLPLCSKANPAKSFKKLPESMLAVTMIDSASLLGNEDTLGIIYSHCAKLQSDLAFESFKYAQQVESLVLNPMQLVLETEIPAITRLRKQLTKLTLDMDSAKGRFHSTLKQSSGASSASLSSKVEILRNEMEQAESRVHQCRDQLIIEMYSFLAREGQLSDALLALVNSQIQFHRRTLESLENSLPLMQRHSESSISRPMFGCSLETHLQQAKQDISLVIEKCIRSLILHGLDEEGLFRVPSSSTKVKKLKAGLDANIVNMEDYYDDPHCIAAVLKSYLRELPEPLMTFELYNDWMHITQLPEELRQNALWVVVDKLPKPNYNNLRYIIKFLAKLAANSNCNKMSPSNIAIVIGPSLLWPPGENGPSVLTAASHSAIIGILINRSEWFFPGDLDFGVSESDVVNNARNRLTFNGQSSSSSVGAAATPSFVSKYRFFGGVFDGPGRADLKLSPSKTRLSLNSLTSLNDVDGDFERKFSFSSLLEDRTTHNWDSESSSFKSRVRTGKLSLNTSFLFANRSPIPSSFTSPTISMANILSADIPSPLDSVTESPIFSVSPFDFSPFGPSFTFSKDTETQMASVANVTKVSSSDCGGSCSPSDQPPSAIISRSVSEHERLVAAEAASVATRTTIESQTIKGDSKEIPDLLSTVFRSSNDASTTVSKSSAGSSKYSSEEANPVLASASHLISSASHRHRAFVKLELKPEKNTGIEGFQTDAKSSGSLVVNREHSVVSTVETFVEESPQTIEVSLGEDSNQIKTVSLNFRVSDNHSSSEVCEHAVTATEDLTVGSSVEKSPWLNRIGAKLGLASRSAPGKERVKLHKAFQRFGFTFHREGHGGGDRGESDDLPFDSKPTEAKQAKKKLRSLSASSPYDVAKPVSSSSKDAGGGRRAESVRSSSSSSGGGLHTVAAGLDTMMRKNGNALLHLATGGSALRSTAFGSTTTYPRNISSTSSTLSSDSDGCAGGDLGGRGRREVGAKEACVAAANCVDSSAAGKKSNRGIRAVAEDGSGVNCKPRSSEGIASRDSSGNAVFPFPDRSCEGQSPSN